MEQRHPFDGNCSEPSMKESPRGVGLAGAGHRSLVLEGMIGQGRKRPEAGLNLNNRVMGFWKGFQNLLRRVDPFLTYPFSLNHVSCESSFSPLSNGHDRAGETAQWMKVFASKLSNLSSIPRTHMVEVEKEVYVHAHMHVHVLMHVCAHTHTHQCY